ncbi:MAG TPA: type IV pilus twitching motility protein PilT [Myxococcota bacterium]|nr:type IV pilus twitching motility protein PilT [Myxococcota bacterium]
MAHIDDMLRHMKQHKGSDLHLAAGIAPRMRSHGELVAVEGWPVLTDASLRELVREIAAESDWAKFEASGDLDFAYGLEGVARFRANYFVQERGAGAVFRIIPEEILSLEDLKLPAAIGSFCHLNQGLVLITGPTGSGKSTTLAAVINEINRSYSRHIVTIEDPVEFVHQNQQSILSHREVGSHTRGFTPALRASIRQDADVVLVGEMRDMETIALAITAAEMGMLVFGTLHTNSATKTVDRIVDAFPAEEQNQIRVSLSESLAGVVSQLLLRTADGKGRCAVHEILLKTSGLANVIREGNTPMLNSLIQSGKAQGMQSMDDALFAAVQSGKVRAVDAHMKATDKARFEALIAKEEGAGAS